MWIDDPELIDKLGELSGASIVVTKQGRDSHKLRKLQRLQEINERTPGLPIRAFPALGGMALKVDGKPIVVGPYDPMDDGVVPTIRTLGYRKRGDFPPIMHAKLALLKQSLVARRGPARSRGGCHWIHTKSALGLVGELHELLPPQLGVRLLDRGPRPCRGRGAILAQAHTFFRRPRPRRRLR